ncbi:hypothetical protein FRC01_007287 [Tulasnella sp. 417]|nr:hypothetical protein FRC01_007287 [Tulasnella sp. 417]
MATLPDLATTHSNSDPRAPYPPASGLNSRIFYQRYDALAEEIDETMVKGLKEHLDGLLIFVSGLAAAVWRAPMLTPERKPQAGLFAGVNSAFLALTLPLLSADPVDDTNALLLQNNALLLHLALGRNDSPPQSFTLPSSTFTASHNILAINILFSTSLALALISSFIAVFGRQWLIYYRKRGGGGSDRERWEQLKRYLGAEKWQLQFILDDILPSILQAGLVIFCISLLLYLHTLHPTVSRIVGIPMYIGLAVAVLSAICTVWDKFCPFQSPLSHFISWCVSVVRHALGFDQTNEDEGESASLHVAAIRRAISTGKYFID